MNLKKRISLMLVLIIILQVILPTLTIIIESDLTLKSIAYDGTEYYINTAQDLWDFAEEVNNGDTFKGVTVYLTADIDLGCSEENQWIPIGWNNEFEGTFEGNNHTINEMYISKIHDENNNKIGLFGKNSGIIKNLTIDNSSININNLTVSYVGTICSYNNGEIYNCINKTNITITNMEESAFIGGIVGNNNYGIIINCINYANITINTYNVGGIVGNNKQGYIDSCKNFGIIESTFSKNSFGSNIGVGGIIGTSTDGGRILNCENDGNITGKNYIGGIVGSIYTNDNYYEKYIDVLHCTNRGIITGSQAVGGIVGNFQAYKTEEENTIYACSNYGEINCVAYGGGIIGEAAYIALTIEECFNVGNIGGSHHLGGICGTMSSHENEVATIVNCYNRGNVEWNHGSVGGIVGSCGNINVKNVYTTGVVVNTGENVGIVLGKAYGEQVNLEGIYYIKIDGEEPLGTESNGDISKVINKTEDEMKKETFIGNSFESDLENINNGYPILKWQKIVTTKLLTGIIVSQAPTKTNYVEQQNFDITGMIVKAIYDDGSEKEITNYTLIDEINLTTGKTSVRIIYTENGIPKETAQSITVTKKVLTGINVTTPPIKTTYREGQKFDRTGMIVTATYNNGTSMQLGNYTVTDGDNLPIGKTTVIISYTENGVTKQATQEITVTASVNNEEIKYYINTEQDMLDFTEEVNNGNSFEGITVYLMNNIEITESFRAIGNSEESMFEGTFDGDNKTIYVNTETFSGLFGYIGQSGIIKNVILESNNNMVFPKALSSSNKGIIQNCINKVNLDDAYGGITRSNSGTIFNCKNYGDISGTYAQAGGIASYNYGVIDNCQNYGNISTTRVAGGITGDNEESGIIQNCFNKGNIIISEDYAGGISAGNTGYIYNCYNAGDIVGQDDSFGTAGICGMTQKNKIVNCYNVGKISGEYPGGIIGCENGGNTGDCYYLDISAPYSNGYDQEDSGKMTEEEMKQTVFVNILNNNLQEGWNKWEKDEDNLNRGYPIMIEKTLTGIAITKVPDNTRYIEGQNFNAEGMVVTVTYNDGTTKEITNYTIPDGNNLAAGKTSVTISYTENGVTKEVTQGITVTAKALTGIAATKAPTNTTYIEGQNFNAEGMVVTATYNDGTTKEITDYKITDGNNLTAGKTSVTISYTENGVTKEVTQGITVTAKALTGIAATKAPTNTTYIEGQNFNAEGMIVTATYNDGTTKEITDYKVTDGNNLTAGKTSVTISYTENGVAKTATQGITVTERLKIEIEDYTENKEENGIYIENILPSTSIGEITSKIGTNGKLEIFKGTEKITDTNKNIGTGMKIKITLNDESIEYTAVVKGDLTGDGEMKDADLLKMARYKVGLDKTLTGAYLKAADINNNNENADAIDLLKLARILVGLDKF